LGQTNSALQRFENGGSGWFLPKAVKLENNCSFISEL
jgi:hypothetical protein